MKGILLFIALLLTTYMRAQNADASLVGGQLIITQIANFSSTQLFELTQVGTDLNIREAIGGGFSVSGGVVIIDAQNVQVPLAAITNGILIDGVSVPNLGNEQDRVSIEADLNLGSGDLTIQNVARVQQLGTVSTTSGNVSYTTTKDILMKYSPLTQGEIITQSGNITFNANQQATPANGVHSGILVDKMASLQSVDGDIILNGRGGDVSNFNHGVFMNNGGQVQTTGTGNITLNGTMAPGCNQINRGVYVRSTASLNETSIISVVDGDIEIIGSSNGLSSSEGVWLDGNITSSGVGTITVTGSGGVYTTGNDGVVINGYNISSVTGDILITGNGGGNGGGNENSGVIMFQGTIESTGAATITINGNAGLGIDENYGVKLRGGAFVRSVNSAISITGEANSNATGIENYGIYLESNPQVVSTGTASINLTGIGSNGAEDLFATAAAAGGIIGGSSASGDITINTDTLSLADVTTGNMFDVNLQSTGNLFILPRTASTTIGLGDNASGELNLTSEELNTFADGFL